MKTNQKKRTDTVRKLVLHQNLSYKTLSMSFMIRGESMYFSRGAGAYFRVRGLGTSGTFLLSVAVEYRGGAT